MTREELAAHADWEGGVTEYIMGYGCSYKNLPEDVPPEVRVAWKKLYESTHDVDTIQKWLWSE